MRLRRPILNTLAAVAVAAVTLATSLPALAQTAFPSRPVRMVVNFPPGGAADLIARAVAAPLSEIGRAHVLNSSHVSESRMPSSA